MNIRAATPEDFEAIARIAYKSTKDIGLFYKFDDQNMAMMVVEDESGIVGFGYLRKHVEAIFVPDPDELKRVKVEALKLLNERASKISMSAGIDQIHVFITDEHFADILMRHFGYRKCVGEALYLDSKPNG